MKLRTFSRELTAAGCVLHRHGKRHDIYRYPTNGRQAPIPRHREIADTLCALIRSQLGLRDGNDGGRGDAADPPAAGR